MTRLIADWGWLPVAVLVALAALATYRWIFAAWSRFFRGGGE